jgi:hypothetical protein
MDRSDILDLPDLQALRAAVANSPIVVAQTLRPVRHFADWCERHDPAELDAVILAWIASHVPARRLSALS